MWTVGAQALLALVKSEDTRKGSLTAILAVFLLGFIFGATSCGG